LIGSLIFMHKAIKPARTFINRILALLRQIKSNRQSIEVDDDMQRDLRWFVECAVACNGSVKIDKNFYPHIDMYIGASSAGLGAYWENNVYQMSFNDSFQANIAYLEAVNIVVVIKTWGHMLQSKCIKVWCDNSAAVAVINLGWGHNSNMQAVARNVWLLASQFDLEIQFQHIQGSKNSIADLLSRWDSYNNPHAALYSLLNNNPEWARPMLKDLELNMDI
jgi:hypothetical protein